MSIAFNFHNDVLTVVVQGKVYNVAKNDTRFVSVKQALKDSDEDKLLVSLNAKEAIKNYVSSQSGGLAEYKDGKVFYKGEELHNVIVDRIKEFAKNGLPFEHLLKFIENISLNPSYRAQQELFTFLSHKYLPITEDGCFYAYKSIREDWTDVYSGTISNKIGNTITMERGNVDDDKDKGCSKGLHCGTIEYVTGYGGTNKRIIIVKVNPKDVVSVPSDCTCQKVRVCEYYCHSEYVKPLENALYRDEISYDDEDDWDDENWDEWDDLDDDYDDYDEYDEDDEEDEDNDYVTSKDVKVTQPKRDQYGRFCK